MLSIMDSQSEKLSVGGPWWARVSHATTVNGGQSDNAETEVLYCSQWLTQERAAGRCCVGGKKTSLIFRISLICLK